MEMIIMKKIVINCCANCPNYHKIQPTTIFGEVVCKETGNIIAQYCEEEKQFDLKINSIPVWCPLLDD
jgi:hypothetical protein